MEGYRSLREGQRVRFEWLGSRAAHGRKAVQRVRPLATATESRLKPFGRIFIFEGHDLAIRPHASAAKRWIEPYDVAVSEIYDELGRRLRATVVGGPIGRGGRVELSVTDDEPAVPQLVARVAEFLDAAGERVSALPDDPGYLSNAASILLARQDRDLLFWRIRRLLRRIRGPRPHERGPDVER